MKTRIIPACIFLVAGGIFLLLGGGRGITAWFLIILAVVLFAAGLWERQRKL